MEGRMDEWMFGLEERTEEVSSKEKEREREIRTRMRWRKVAETEFPIL